MEFINCPTEQSLESTANDKEYRSGYLDAIKEKIFDRCDTNSAAYHAGWCEGFRQRTLIKEYGNLAIFMFDDSAPF